jgi:hypothetical protein
MIEIPRNTSSTLFIPRILDTYTGGTASAAGGYPTFNTSTGTIFPIDPECDYMHVTIKVTTATAPDVYLKVSHSFQPEPVYPGDYDVLREVAASGAIWIARPYEVQFLSNPSGPFMLTAKIPIFGSRWGKLQLAVSAGLAATTNLETSILYYKN